jgi:hypothetical protein
MQLIKSLNCRFAAEFGNIFATLKYDNFFTKHKKQTATAFAAVVRDWYYSSLYFAESSIFSISTAQKTILDARTVIVNSKVSGWVLKTTLKNGV